MVAKIGMEPENIFYLPDLGEGLEEAELVEWCVHVGQTVKENDTLARMETAKALVDVPSPRAGTIAILHGEPGQVIKVGCPLVTYAKDEGGRMKDEEEHRSESARRVGVLAHDSAREEQTRSEKREARNEKEGTEGEGRSEKREVRREKDEEPRTNDKGQLTTDKGQRTTDQSAVGNRQSAMSNTVVGNLAESEEAKPGEVLAAPAVRRLARELGVDLASIHGTGIGGRIMPQDVKAAANGGYTTERPQNGGAAREQAKTQPEHQSRAGMPAPAEPSIRRIDPTAAPQPIEPPPANDRPAPPASPRQPMRIPFRGTRRMIAEHLRHSITHAVHFTVMDEADIGALDALRRKLAAASGEKVSILPFIASAVCRVLCGKAGEHLAQLNSTVDDDKQEILQHHGVHLGIATDTDTGLMVPVLRDADRLGVLQLSREIARLAAGARARTLSPDQLRGSTFTLSNVGPAGGRFATPILNYPEVGILAIGRAREAVIVRDHLLGPGTLLPLSLSCDHRVIDGATAATALAKIIDLLARPEELMEPARGE